MNGMRSHTRRAIVGSLMDWLEPLVALAQNDSLAVQEWANEVLERIDIYSHREMRQQVQKNGFAVLRCLASASQPRGAQRAASAALVSILEERCGQEVDVVQDLGIHAILSLAASPDDQAWTYTVLAISSLQANAVPLVLSATDLPRQGSGASKQDGDDNVSSRGDGCLPLLLQLVHGNPPGAQSGRSIEHQYRMQSFCVNILARAAATEGIQQVLVEAGATAALISAARQWLRECERAQSTTDADRSEAAAGQTEGSAIGRMPVQIEHLSAAVLATANLAETTGFAERTFVQCDHEEGAESGLDGLLALIQEILVDARGTEAARHLLPHAARTLASLAHSAQESGYIGNWIIGAIFDKGLMLPLELITRDQESQRAGPMHPDLMRHIASSLAELAKAHGAPLYSRSATADPQKGDAVPPQLARGNSGTPILNRASSSGLSSGLSRGNSGLSDLEDGPGGSMSSLTQSLSNLSEIVTGSARSLGLWPGFQAAGSGSFRAEDFQGGSMHAGRRFSSVCADEPAAMLPRIVQECQSCDVSAGWIARLARNADPDVQRCAASIYSSICGTAQSWLIADDDDNKLDELARVLLTLAGTDSVDTRKASKMTIVALAKYSEEYRAALVAHATALKPVLLLLTKSVVDLQEEKRGDLIAEQRLAASILRYIIGSSPCREVAMRGALADAVASVLRLNDDVEISTQMSFVFADISRDPETKQKLDSEFIGALQHMMKDDDIQSQTVQMNAVAAVRHIASEPRLQSLLQSMGIVPILVRLAGSQWDDVRTDAVEALRALTEHGGVLDPAAASHPAGGLPRQSSDGSGSGADVVGLDGGITDIKESQLEFHSRLGAGAYGEVFHGRWRGSDVAIKCMYTKRGGINDDPKAAERERNREFRNEVHLLMQARHPNIVLLMGTMVSSRRMCIISELCHRGSLYKVLHQTSSSGSGASNGASGRSRKPLPPWSRRLQMMQDAASGCQFLHSNEPCIVHLDLKSPNLLVDKNWNVKVADFGLAQLKQHFFVGATGPVGTPEWTAPEVLKSEPFNESADVYSFGVVLWEMATRCKPFAGMLPHQVMAKVGFNSQQLERPTPEQTGGPLPDGYVELMYDCMSIQWQDRPRFDRIRPRLEEIQRAVIASEKRGGSGARPRARVPESEPAGPRPARTDADPQAAAAQTAVEPQQPRPQQQPQQPPPLPQQQQALQQPAPPGDTEEPLRNR